MKSKFIFLKCFLSSACLLLNFAVSASLFPFTATYSGANEVPPNASPATGTIRGVYDDVTNTIYYKIEFSGLMTATVAAHFHAAALPGVNAPVIYPHAGFPTGVTSGTFISSNIITAAQEEQLKAGSVYSNIHTTGLPGGEIRAQIILGPAVTNTYAFTRTYSGANEVPPNASAGTGTITGFYEPLSNTIFYTINFSGLSSGTVAAHFHAPAAAGVNAPVMYGHRNFPTGVTSGSLTGFDVITEVQEGFLTSGMVYSNIHTSTFPGGEIRAQILLDATPAFSCPANITSANDPGVCTALEAFVSTTAGFPAPVVTYTINNVSVTSPFAFPVGTTTVTATATNTTGTVSCNFTVTVNDTEAPVISGMSASPSELWPPNNKMRDVTVNYTSTDNCPGTITCGLTVTSNEGSSADWEVIDANHVKLRAKRSGNGDGRTYTITTTCRDATGNISASSSTTVKVPHDRGNGSGNNGNNNNTDKDELVVNVASNPTTTAFNVTVTSPELNGALQVRVYNLSGVLVESRNNVRQDQLISIGGSLPPGVYMLEVRHGNMVSRTKLIKQ